MLWEQKVSWSISIMIYVYSWKQKQQLSILCVCLVGTYPKIFLLYTQYMRNINQELVDLWGGGDF